MHGYNLCEGCLALNLFASEKEIYSASSGTFASFAFNEALTKAHELRLVMFLPLNLLIGALRLILVKMQGLRATASDAKFVLIEKQGFCLAVVLCNLATCVRSFEN